MNEDEHLEMYKRVNSRLIAQHVALRNAIALARRQWYDLQLLDARQTALFKSGLALIEAALQQEVTSDKGE